MLGLKKFGIGFEHIAQDDKGIKNAEGVGSKLSRNDIKEVKNIENKRMKGKLKASMKKLFIQGKMTRRAGSHLVIQSKSMNMNVVWKFIILSKSKDFDLNHQ